MHVAAIEIFRTTVIQQDSLLHVYRLHESYGFCEQRSLYKVPIQVRMPKKEVTLIKNVLDETFVSFGHTNMCLSHFLFSLV
jgi:hypothetical protein